MLRDTLGVDRVPIHGEDLAAAASAIYFIHNLLLFTAHGGSRTASPAWFGYWLKGIKASGASALIGVVYAVDENRPQDDYDGQLGLLRLFHTMLLDNLYATGG